MRHRSPGVMFGDMHQWHTRSLMENCPPRQQAHTKNKQVTTRDVIEQHRASARLDLCKQKQHEVNCTTQTDFKGYDVLFTAVIL